MHSGFFGKHKFEGKTST